MSTPETLRLAELATTLSLSDLSEAARTAARWGILDAVACGIAAIDEPVAERVRRFVTTEYGTGASSLWGTSGSASASGAALANGTAAHALDFDDVCWAMYGHPSTVLAPAAIALGEATDASGADLLAAYAAGFEVLGRLGEALGRSHYEAGFHPTATLGTLGATTTAGVLLGLDAPTLAGAFGIACSSAAGLRLNFGTDTKPLHAGLAAQAGVTASMLAHAGVTARRDALEGPMGFATLYAGTGTHFRTDRERLCLVDPGIEHKPYPCCRFTHRIIEAVVILAERHRGVTPEKIICHVSPLGREILIYDRAETGLEAKFCMQAAAAIAWLDGAPTVASFSDARVVADDVRSLAARVELAEGTPEQEEVRVVLPGGALDQASITLPLGHPERPLSPEQHRAKVHGAVAPVLGARGADDLIDAVTAIETVRSIRDLGRMLRAS